MAIHDESFMRSLFFGLIDESRIFPWPQRSAAEIDSAYAMIDRVHRFFERTSDSAGNGRGTPRETIDGLRRLGCFGTLVPAAYGGLELSRTAHFRVLQEVATADSDVVTALISHHLGVKALLLFGTDSQKARYLPVLARGDRLAAFALAENGIGSDAAAIRMHADLQPDGAYVLDGSKTCMADCTLADLFVLFARTSSAEEGIKPKVTAFVIEGGPGIRSNAPKPGTHGPPTWELVLSAVRVAPENVCGNPGEGFRIAMHVLSSERLGLACQAMGLCKRAIRLSVDRCRHQQAFGRSIGELGLVQDKIASMVSDTWALESMAYLTAGMASAESGPLAIESAICKVFGSETAFRVAMQATQIAAAGGCASDPRCERLVDEARTNLVFDETNEILRAFIALSGMHGPGRELADVARAVREPIRSFGLLGELAIQKARNALARAQMTRHAPSFDPEAKVFDRYVHVLARAVEKMLRRHGHDIAEMQRSQKRIADMAIDLFAVAACLARTSGAIERRGEDGARRETDLTRILVASATTRLGGLAAAMDVNDDELRKAVSSKTCADGAYPFDVV